MALRYQQVFPESGDVLNPRDWNLSHAEFAHEMNGYLDRDNVPVGCVTETRIVLRSGSNLRTDAYSANLTTLNDRSEWQDSDGAGVYVGRITFTAAEDCLLACEWGGTFDWDTSGHPGGYTLTTNIVNAIRFRIVVDGTTIAESGFDEEGRDRHHTYIVGSIPVQAGYHEVKVEYQKSLITNFTLGEGSSLGCTLNERELLVHQRIR